MSCFKLLLVLVILTAYCGCGQALNIVSTLPGIRTVAGIEDGLVANWRFDESGGDVLVDWSGNGFNGSLYGNPIPTTSDHGSGYLLDGGDDFMAIPDDTGPPPGAFNDIAYGSIALWFRYDDILNNGEIPPVMPVFYYGESNPGAPRDMLMIYIGHNHLENPAQRQVYFWTVGGGQIAL